MGLKLKSDAETRVRRRQIGMIHFHSRKITRAVEGAGHTPIAEEDASGVDATGTDAETSDQRLGGDPRVTLIRGDLVTV